MPRRLAHHFHEFIKRISLRLHPKHFFCRMEPYHGPFRSIRSSLRAVITIFIMSMVGYYSEVPLMLAPFAATCVSIYTNPQNPFVQPLNILGGYTISATVGVFVHLHFPHEWWTLGLMTGLTMVVMSTLRSTHPPALTVPLLLYLDYRDVGYDFVLFPVFSGSLLLVVIAIILLSLPPVQEYPGRTPRHTDHEV